MKKILLMVILIIVLIGCNDNTKYSTDFARITSISETEHAKYCGFDYIDFGSEEDAELTICSDPNGGYILSLNIVLGYVSTTYVKEGQNIYPVVVGEKGSYEFEAFRKEGVTELIEEVHAILKQGQDYLLSEKFKKDLAEAEDSLVEEQANYYVIKERSFNINFDEMEEPI